MEEHFVVTAEGMIEFGKALGAELLPGGVIGLVGDLGAGKTHLTKGICAALGADDTTSPTFKLVNEVEGGSVLIYHFDFYRVKQAEELLDLGWDDYIEAGGIVVAEWADMFPELMPAHTLWIKVEHAEGGRRILIKRS